MSDIGLDETPLYSCRTHLVLKEFVNSNYTNPIFASKGVFPMQVYAEDGSPPCFALQLSGYNIVLEPNRYVLHFTRHHNPRNEFCLLARTKLYNFVI